MVRNDAENNPPIALSDFAAIDIPLANGGFTTIDIEDAPRVLQYRWFRAQPKRNKVSYAMATQRINGNTTTLLHRFVLGARTGICVDHKDCNGLNNRRSNLRFCTFSQNRANTAAQSNNKLGVKGVRLRGGKYQAEIRIRGRAYSLGAYRTIGEASFAYQNAARKYFGEFANHVGPKATG